MLPSSALLRDEFIEENLKNKQLEKPYVNLDYNYESFERIPIKLVLDGVVTTKNNGLVDGQILNFVVKENVFHNGQLLLQQGTNVTGKVQTSVQRGMNGIPGKIIVDDFAIENIPQEKLKGIYTKKGKDYSLLVFPIKWALTPIPGVGSLTNFIIGGHAKITKKNVITIYYYPNWSKKEVGVE